MKLYRAELIDTLEIPVGTAVKLESLRQAVVPPYFMLMPFIDVRECIAVEEQLSLEEDGIHGCIYVLRAVAACQGKIIVGFRDLQSNEITHSKAIALAASRANPLGASKSRGRER